jgi:hypothetical protein
MNFTKAEKLLIAELTRKYSDLFVELRKENKYANTRELLNKIHLEITEALASLTENSESSQACDFRKEICKSYFILSKDKYPAQERLEGFIKQSLPPIRDEHLERFNRLDSLARTIYYMDPHWLLSASEKEFANLLTSYSFFRDLSDDDYERTKLKNTLFHTECIDTDEPNLLCFLKSGEILKHFLILRGTYKGRQVLDDFNLTILIRNLLENTVGAYGLVQTNCSTDKNLKSAIKNHFFQLFQLAKEDGQLRAEAQKKSDFLEHVKNFEMLKDFQWTPNKVDSISPSRNRHEFSELLK